MIPVLALTAVVLQHTAPCEVGGIAARCGDHQVFEDRSARRGRMISIHYVVLPALGHDPAPDPIFIITGGPGQAATDSVAPVAEEYASLREKRDMVFVDQRGTGGSNRLKCDPFSPGDSRRYLGPPPTRRQIARCRETLSRFANLALYTTTIAVDDLDEIRATLGYDTINLDGGSYGTRVALEYLRRHPGSARTAVLRGVSPFDYAIPLHFARAGQDALDAVLAECASSETCNRAHPDLPAKVGAILRSLKASPVVVRIASPATGSPIDVTLTADVFASRLHLLLFRRSLAALIPSFLDAGSRGDFKDFAEIAAQFGRAITDSIDFGMQLSVACAEDVPFISEESAVAETRNTFLGMIRIRQAKEYCREWPRGKVPAGWLEPVNAATPVLAISGARDPATPPAFAAKALAGLPNARHFIIANGSHIEAGDCVTNLVAAFLEHPTATLDPSCLQKAQALAFP